MNTIHSVPLVLTSATERKRELDRKIDAAVKSGKKRARKQDGIVSSMKWRSRLYI